LVSVSARFWRGPLDEARLLSLDRVDDPESLEASRFAQIDPADPAVEKICKLTDALRSHLLAFAETEVGEPLWEEVMAPA